MENLTEIELEEVKESVTMLRLKKVITKHEFDRIIYRINTYLNEYNF